MLNPNKVYSPYNSKGGKGANGVSQSLRGGEGSNNNSPYRSKLYDKLREGKLTYEQTRQMLLARQSNWKKINGKVSPGRKSSAYGGGSKRGGN